MKILLLQLRRIGDLILTTPAFAALRQRFPEAELTLVISPGCADLAPAIPHVDKVHVVKGVRPFFRIARSRFDCVVDFTRNDRSALLTLLSGAPRRITAARVKRRARLRGWLYTDLVECSLKATHTVDLHLAMLRPLGIEDAPPRLELNIPESAQQKAADVISANNIRKPYVVFHPGSARPEKFWGAQRWAEVIDEMADKGSYTIVLTGGGASMELAHVSEIKSLCRTPAIDLAGKIDLLTLAALLQKAALVVTVDSAPLHLAAAAGTPLVALFGPTNPFHWHPRAGRALILQGESESPVTCFVPKQPRIPMNQISTRAVIDAMKSLLSTPAMRASAQHEHD